MRQLNFRSARERIRKAFGRPFINPPHVASSSQWRAIVGPTVLCATIGLGAVVGAHDKFPLPAPLFDATAQPEALADSSPSLPEHVTEATPEARCEQLWNLFDAQGDIIKIEGRKPGFTPAYKSAARLGYLTALQIKSQGCPLSDPETFDAELQSLHALNLMEELQ